MKIGKRLLSITLGCLLVLLSIFSTGGFVGSTAQASETIDAYELINPVWNSGRSSGITVSSDGWFMDNVGPNSWIRFDNVDFGTAAPHKFEFKVSLNGIVGTITRPIQVRVGSLDGPIIADGLVQATGSWTTWSDQSISVNAEVIGVQDIFIIFNKDGATGSWGGNFQWFSFGSIDAFEQIDPSWANGYEGITINASGISGVNPDSWVLFKSVDFGDIMIAEQFQMEFASASTEVRPMEIRLDSLDGFLLGNAAETSTNGLTTYSVQQFDLNEVTEPLGKRDVYIKFNIGMTGLGGNFKWFRFLGYAPITGLNITAETVVLSTIGQTSSTHVVGVTENGSFADLPEGTVLAYESSDTQVVTVDQNGIITAQGTGTAEITVSTMLDNKLVTGAITIEVIERVDVYYYISTTGSDSNPGTEELPFRTLTKAQAVVRNLIKDGMTGDVTVYLRGGLYLQTSGITYNESDSGRDGYEVRIAAYPGETPILDYALYVSNWQAVDDNIYKAPMTLATTPGNMWENGQRIDVARHPNKGDYREGYNTVAAPMVTANPRTQFRFNEGDIPEGLVADGNLEVYIWAGGPQGHQNWTAYLRTVTNIDYVNRIITLASNVGYDMGPGSRYYIRGAKQLIDAPGEYYYDTVEKMLYYWPINSDINASQIAAPRFLSGVNFRGANADNLVSNMVFEGITVRHSNFTQAAFSWSAPVVVRFADNVTFRNNHIYASGANGIEARDVIQNCTFYGNLIEDVAVAGINFGGTSNSTVINNNKIINNVIRTTGQIMGHGMGIKITSAPSNVIAHNRVYDSTRYAISIKGRSASNNIVQYNDVFDVNKDSQDTGLIEMWTPGTGNIIDHNRVYNSEIHFSFGFGIYLDDASNYNTVSNNFITGLQQFGDGDLRHPLFIKGIENQILNNYVVNNQNTLHGPFGSHQLGEDANYDLYLERNIFYNSGPSVYRFGNWSEDRYAYADYQLVYNDAGSYGISNAPGAFNFDEWKTILDYKYDQLSMVAHPEFMDEAKGDYRLRYDSPARKLGIEEIDFANMGLLPDYMFGNGNDPLEYIYPITTDGKTLTLVSIANGETAQMNVMGRTLTGYIADFSSADITYESNDSNIATVDASGLITAVSEGVAEVTVTVTRGSEVFSSFIHVLVDEKLDTVTLRAGRTQLEVGEKTPMHIFGEGILGSFTMFPVDSDAVVVTKNNPEFLSIDDKGNITAIAAGLVTIEAEVTVNDVTVTGEITIAVGDQSGPGAPIDAYSPINPIQSKAHSGLNIADSLMSNTAPGSWVLFERVDFGTIIANRLELEVAVPASNAGGVLEIRLGSLTGQLLGTAVIEATDGWSDFQQQVVVLDNTEINDIQDVYLIFSDSNADIAGNFQSLRFYREPVPPSAPWQVMDFGQDTVSTIDVMDGKYNITTNGFDIWGEDDEFTFMYQNVPAAKADSMSVIATIDSVQWLNNNTSVGVMIRDTSESNSFNVTARIRPSGALHLTYRNPAYPETWFTSGMPTLTFPATLKLTREGDVFTGYYLNNNGDWVQFGQHIVPMSGDVMAGVNAFSRVEGVDASFTVSNVSIETLPDIPVLPAMGVIDRPANAATVSGTTAVTGWFLDGGVAVEAIEVLMNGEVVGAAQHGITRNDVASAYPDYANSNAGFHYALNTTTFANGSYTLGIKVTDVNGEITILPARTIVIANVLKAFGTIDRPSLGAEISGRAPVTGWFLNDKGVEKVEVLINGTVVGQATYGITRNDVAAAYPIYNNAAAGYQYILDTAAMTNDEYTLTIEATDLEGNKTIVAERTVTVNNVLASIGTIDSPSNNAQVNGTVVVRGWYLDPNDVEKIEILVDEEVVGEAYYGTTRNDVFAVYGAYNNAQSGYYFMLDTTTLINGGYTLTIKVTDGLGNVKTLTRSIVVENE